MPISPEQYDAYESCILSGQIPDEEVPKLLAENPGFAAWYKERMEQRRRRC